MFIKILVLILFTDISIGHLSHLNCTEVIPVSGKGIKTYEIKERQKVVCFRADSGEVDVMCRECLDFDFIRMGCLCDCGNFDVYNGCNGTTDNDKVVCRNGRWTSKKTGCLMIVWTTSPKETPCRMGFFFGMSWLRCKERFWEHYKHGCKVCMFEYCGRQRCRKPHRVPSPRPYRRPSITRTRIRSPSTPKPTTQSKTEMELSGPRGNFSPAEPYKKNLDISYKITLAKNERIQLIFRMVNLTKRVNGICSDYITVVDGVTTWSPTLIKEFCENEYLNVPIISTSNTLTVKFVTDGIDTENRGFQATYEPYQEPTENDMTQKLTGVVIGTACGMVFLALTFLAICHSRRLTLLHFVRGHYDAQSTCETDAVQVKAPPAYDDVMAAPEKYPLTHDSKQVAQPPSYEVVVNQIPGQEEQQRSEPTNEISREIEGVELTHETRDETNENEDDHLNNTERESDISDGGDDVAEVEENETSSDIRRSSSLIDDRHPDSQRRSCDEGCCENTASGVQPMNDSEVDVGADGDANEENDLEVVVASCKLDIAQSDVDASCKLDIAQSDVDDTKKESEITTSPNYPHVITTDV